MTPECITRGANQRLTFRSNRFPGPLAAAANWRKKKRASMMTSTPFKHIARIELAFDQMPRSYAHDNKTSAQEHGEVLVHIENLELRRMTSLSVGKDARARSNGNSSTVQLFKSRNELVAMLSPLTRQERVGLLAKWLTSEIKDTMGQAADGLTLDKLPPSTAFLENGLDSLLITELQRRIQEKLDLRFKPMQGLDYQSIESMAGYILSEVLANDLALSLAPNPAPELVSSAV